MANQVEILLKATDEASAVLKSFGDNADTALQGTTASAANTSAGMESLAGASTLAITAVTAVVGAVVALGAAYAASLSGLLGYVEGLEKANQSTGVSIEFWQKLIKSGEEVNISFDQMRGAVERMEKAIEGNGVALAKFGIEVANFKGLNPDEALRAMAAQMQAIQDPMIKAAAEMAVFNRSGAELDPILKAIVSGAVDAQRVLGTDTVESLLKTEQALDGVKTAWNSAKQELVAFIALKLPLTEFLEYFKLGLQHFGDFANALKLAVSGHAYLAGEMLAAARAADQQTTSVRGTSQATLGLIETERQLRVGLAELGKMWEADEKAATKTTAAQMKAAKEVEAAWLKANADIAADGAARTAEHIRRYKQEADRSLAEVERRIAAEKKLATETERSRDRMEDADLQYFERAIAGSLRKTETEVEHARRLLNEVTANRYEMLATYEETAASMLAADEAVAAAEKALDDAKTAGKIANCVLIMESASSILKSLFGKSKTATIAAAIIDTIASIVKTLAAYPWPWSLAPAAAAAAAGYAEVKKIQNQEIGFAQGTPGTSFMDFGPASQTVLHGEEAVITKAQGESLAEMIRAALDRRGGGPNRGGDGGPPQHIHIHVGEREFWDVAIKRNKAGLLPLRVS